MAKTDAAHRALAAQFASREVVKVYLALVEGSPRFRAGIIDAPIARDPVHRKKMRVTSTGRGREAITEYRVIATAGGKSLVECRPRTGRTHQIRVHLKHLGCPVLGDPLYGRRGSFSRHMLHAWKLQFRHPLSDERLTFEAAPHRNFESLEPTRKLPILASSHEVCKVSSLDCRRARFARIFVPKSKRLPRLGMPPCRRPISAVKVKNERSTGNCGTQVLVALVTRHGEVFLERSHA